MLSVYNTLKHLNANGMVLLHDSCGVLSDPFKKYIYVYSQKGALKMNSQ